MDKYYLTVINNSTRAGDACVYQEDPDLTSQGYMKLAWFSKKVNPDTQARFDWGITYNFVWADTGELQPGVRFNASQTRDANLTTNNNITLDYNGGYFFSPTSQGPRENNLYIECSNNIPTFSKASVGVGMSGQGTFVHQAGPNLNAVYTPKPRYFITLGNYVQGQVMDTTVGTPSAEIVFDGTTDMTAILNKSNKWTIIPTSEANAAFVEAYKENRSISYTQALEAI